MDTLTEDKYKTIDLSENKKSLNELADDFKEKFKEIQEFKHDTSCEKYHKLFEEIHNIQNQRVKLALQG